MSGPVTPVSSVITGNAGPLNPTIALISHTTALNPGLVRSFMAAMQVQLDRDYQREYGDSGRLIYKEPNEPLDPTWWQCLLLDHCDEADALGYHEKTDAGMPVMRIGILDDLAAGVLWTATVSHEILESKGDPFIDRTVQVTNSDGSIDEYPYELCDACEDDRFSYAVRGLDGHTHHLSDFVLKAYWRPGATGPYSYRHSLSGPLTLASGGYTGLHRIAPPEQATAWTQVFAAGLVGPRARNKRAFSRTAQRGVVHIAAA